ncbi:MAG TPA: replicative DNA helicase [bacterium]|nr:replicative DNA helicase [bacterium]
MVTARKINPVSSSASAFDRLPPQAIEAEKAVLGSMMIDNDSIGKVIEYLHPECFYQTAHRRIFESALALYEKNTPVDLVTLSEFMKNQKILDDIGGSFYLTELAESIPSAANVEYHSRIVLEKYLTRKLIEESANIAKDCYDSGESVYDILDRSEQRIFNLSENRLRRSFTHISPIMHEAFETIDRFHQRKGTVTGVATGFTKLDELTSGFQQSDLVIIAGRPSMGKTAFSLNIARNIAVESKVPVGFFSLEMSERQLALRLLCAEARVDAHGVRTGRLAENEWSKLSICVGNLVNAPIYIDDSPGVGILEVRAKARRLKKEKQIGILIIDYLQLMQGPRNAESRQQEISVISRSLKALAKELDIPVVALSQLSRAVEARGGERRPLLSDLRESGAIEQDADVVLFIYRQEVYGKRIDEKGNSLEGRSEVIIGKQRNGPVGTVHLNFIKHYARFENPAFEEDVTEPPY